MLVISPRDITGTNDTIDETLLRNATDSKTKHKKSFKITGYSTPESEYQSSGSSMNEFQSPNTMKPLINTKVRKYHTRASKGGYMQDAPPGKHLVRDPTISRFILRLSKDSQELETDPSYDGPDRSYDVSNTPSSMSRSPFHANREQMLVDYVVHKYVPSSRTRPVPAKRYLKGNVDRHDIRSITTVPTRTEDTETVPHAQTQRLYPPRKRQIAFYSHDEIITKKNTDCWCRSSSYN